MGSAGVSTGSGSELPRSRRWFKYRSTQPGGCAAMRLLKWTQKLLLGSPKSAEASALKVADLEDQRLPNRTPAPGCGILGRAP